MWYDCNETTLHQRPNDKKKKTRGHCTAFDNKQNP